MFRDTEAFSGFSVDDAEAARAFYSDVLGMEVTGVTGMEQFGMYELHIKGGHNVLIYQKDNHVPATFTVLSFPVGNIDEAVEQLTEKGVTFFNYHDENMPQDEKGIARGLSMNQGPDIAWFADPAGNNLAILQMS